MSEENIKSKFTRVKKIGKEETTLPLEQAEIYFEPVAAEELISSELPTYTASDENSAPSLEKELPKSLDGVPTNPDLLDDDGQAFDPEIHATDKEGKPRKYKSGNKAGMWRLKRRIVGGKVVEGDEAKEISKEEFRLAAKSYTTVFLQIGGITLGEDFKDCDKDKRIQIEDAFEAVCRKHGTTGLTPEQMLAATLGEYAIEKAMKPSAKERLGLAWYKFKKLFIKETSQAYEVK